MPLSQKAEQYRALLLKLLPQLEHSGGSGGGMELTEFDLYPRDYLAFAETDLEQHTTEARVGCVGHLKRAIDCQIELFFSCLGLESFFSRRRVSFDKKLSFIKAAGLVSPRSLNRLNAIRNRVEHEFADPQDADLTLYFDLCQCFVSVLESYIFYMSCSASAEFEVKETQQDPTIWFGSRIEADRPKIEVRLSRDESLIFEPSELDDFAFALRCHFALVMFGYIGDREECRRRIASA